MLVLVLRGGKVNSLRCEHRQDMGWMHKLETIDAVITSMVVFS